MSRSLNRHEIIGNVGADPELRYTGTGIAVCSFSVATNDTAVVDGEKKQYTEWHRVVAWRKPAELLAEHVKKGAKLYLAGPTRVRRWKDQAGVEHEVVEIHVEDFLFLDTKPQEPQS